MSGRSGLCNVVSLRDVFHLRGGGWGGTVCPQKLPTRVRSSAAAAAQHLCQDVLAGASAGAHGGGGARPLRKR